MKFVFEKGKMNIKVNTNMKKKIFSLLVMVCMTLTASAEEPAFKITVGTNEHGTFAFKVNDVEKNLVNNELAVDADDEITLTIAPDADWIVGTPTGLWVAAEAKAPRRIGMEKDIKLTYKSKDQTTGAVTYTFTMIAANAEISCSYKKLLTHQDITVSDITDTYTYNGSAKQPTVTVKDNETPLTLNTDYTVSYSNNVNAGTATATVTGTGNYAGTVTKQFTINKADMSVSASGYSGTYDGNAHGITVTVNYPSGATLRFRDSSGSFTLTSSPTYSDAGTYYVYYSVTKNNYNTVSSYRTVNIRKAAGTVNYATATIDKAYGDDPFTNELTLTGDGTVSYSSGNTDVADVDADGKVTITGTGDAVITATVADGKNYTYSSPSASFTVNVVPKPIYNEGGTSIVEDANGYNVTVDEDQEEVSADAVIDNNLLDADGSMQVNEFNYYRELDAPSGKSGDVIIDDKGAFLYTVCLPFAPKTASNAKYYALNSASGSSLTFSEVANPVANTPYLVAVTGRKDLNESATCHNITLKKEAGNSTEKDGFVMMGTQTGLTNAEAAAKGAYVLQSGNKWSRVTTSKPTAYLPPFRAYFVATTPNAREMLENSFDGSATGIQNIRTVDRDGTEHWYDLNGRKIANGQKPTAKGIYIQNGKKIVNK